MTSKKRQRRENVAAEEFGLLAEKVREQDALATAADESLFTLDRQGSKTARRKANQEALAVAKSGTISATERKLLRKIADRADKRASPAAAGSIDLWAEETAVPGGGRGVKAKQLVVRGGQSYNPSAKDHQDLLAEVPYCGIFRSIFVDIVLIRR
jgi:hypothetical protein